MKGLVILILLLQIFLFWKHFNHYHTYTNPIKGDRYYAEKVKHDYMRHGDPFSFKKEASR